MNKKPILLLFFMLLLSSVAFSESYDWVRSPTWLLQQNNTWNGNQIFDGNVIINNITYMNTTYINVSVLDNVTANSFCYNNGTCLYPATDYTFNSTQFDTTPEVKIKTNWLTGFINSLIPAFPSLSGYLFTNGSNAEQNINLNNVNLTNLTAEGINLDGSSTPIYEGELVLDGNGDYVSIGSTDDFNLVPYQDQSVSGWVKVNSLSTSQIIYDKRNNNGNTRGYMIATDATSLRAWLYYGNIADSLKVSTPINTDTWYYFAVTLDRDGFMRLYLDGTLKSSVSISAYESTDLTALPATISNLGYKSYSGSGLDYLNGSIDDVQIFNRTLSQEEITNIYNLNRTAYNGSTTGLVAEYNFDGTPNDFSDSSENGNDGTGYGDAYTNLSIISYISNGFFTLSNQTIHYWNDLVSLLNLVNTSDLSNYVPYTGANDDVDLGDNDLTTTGNFTADYFIGDGSQLTNIPTPDLSNYRTLNNNSFINLTLDSTISSWNDVNQSLIPENSTIARIGNCSVGQIVQNITTSGVQCIDAPETNPAGSDGKIQFNDGGAFGGDSNFVWDNTNKKLTLGIKDISGGDFAVYGNNLFGLLTPEMYFDVNGNFKVGINVDSTSTYGGAVALGGDLLTSPYQVRANGNGAFTVSGIADGDYSIAIGTSSYSDGDNSIAIGTRSYSKFGISIGESSYSSFHNSLALAKESNATGFGTTAIGSNSKATGSYSLAIGSLSSASGTYSIAQGYNSKATGSYSLAIGSLSSASGTYSIAQGFNSKANVDDSISIGRNNINNGYSSTMITSGVATKTNSVNNSILFAGSDISNNQVNLLQAESMKGVRIGATSGENINMTGQDLYVANNTGIQGYLVLGDNTEFGLSQGDINASTIYYDTLQAKSPIVMCSNMNCKITVPELEKDYYITRDEDYNIIESKETLPQQVIDKFNKLKENKLDNDAEKDCLSTGQFYEYINKKCIFNYKKECEFNGYSYWTGTQCLDNPYLKCENSNSTSFNWTSNKCEYDAKKDCYTNMGSWNETECIMPEIKEKTIEEQRKDCIMDISTMWKDNKCIELRFYYAEKYVQPTGAHDAYAKGSIIIWNDNYYESLIDANVWSPTTYPAGWKKL